VRRGQLRDDRRVRNSGGFGSASATFHVLANDSSRRDLADCSTAIPATPHNGAVNAGCTAYDEWIRWYFRTYPGSTVIMKVTVTDTYLGGN
jgi:hypothetical protein